MRNLRQSKFVPLAKSVFDLKSILKTQQAVNSLLNSNVVVGAKAAVHHSDSNVVYEVPAPPPAPENFYPFKIYKPDLSRYNIARFGVLLDEDSSPPVVVAIDETVPTDLPTTINPKTDGWRIWAVRTGFVSSRDFSNLPDDSQAIVINGGDSEISTPLSDISISFIGRSSPLDTLPQDGTDGQSACYDDTRTFDGTIFADIDNPIIPIILNSPDGLDVYNFAVWLVSSTTGGYTVKGKYYAPSDAAPFPDVPSYGGSFVLGFGLIIPLGVISSSGNNNLDPNYRATDLVAFQIQYGNALQNYGNFTSFVDGDGLKFCATLNYRGDWDNDDIQNLVFYPGDVIRLQETFNIEATSTGGISTTVKIKDEDGNESDSIFAQSLYLMTNIGYVSGTPKTDTENWVKISGIDTSFLTDPTPNT